MDNSSSFYFKFFVKEVADACPNGKYHPKALTAGGFPDMLMYNRFYIPLSMAQASQKVNDSHQ